MNRVCVPNKTEDLNLTLYNMITGINESKISTKLVLCRCKCKLDGRKCSSNQTWNNNSVGVSVKIMKIITINKARTEHNQKDYIWNLATCSCKNCKYLANVIDESVIMCDEIINALRSKTLAT